MLDEKVYSNAELDQPLAPSDTVTKFLEFLDRNQKEWGLARDVFIDSADQATITELRKYKRLHGSIHNFLDAYKALQIIDRIKLAAGLDSARLLSGSRYLYRAYSGAGAVFLAGRQGRTGGIGMTIRSTHPSMAGFPGGI